MSAELHGKFARINRIDQANFESDIPIRQLMNNAGLKNSENRKNFF
jgi:NAD(P)H-hydrate repair Nnr-like enzyme with NAD(P)H-hydrate epimerase domain